MGILEISQKEWEGLQMSELLKDEIASYIKENGFAESYSIYDLLEGSMQRLANDKQLDLENVEQIRAYLNHHVVRKFIEDRQPVVSPVPDAVITEINQYFSDPSNSLQNFTPIEAYRSSNARSDQHLYGVIAKHKDGTYACWSSFNTSLHSMNSGHYGVSKGDAVNILKNNFFDVTDNPEDPHKYGMENSKVEISQDKESEIQNNIARFRRRGGR